MILCEVQCNVCKETHKIQCELTTTNGGICNLLAFSDIEFEFYCRCGTKLTGVC